MDRILFKDKIFTLYKYAEEKEFEKHVIEHAKEIFGPNAVYIDIKKKIGQDNIVTIPDGYLVDFSFESDPRLYIIENELVTHDPYRHIGHQLLKFAISYKISGRNIKNFLLENILKNKEMKNLVEQGSKKAGYRNLDALLESLIFEKSVSAIVITDGITEDLENVVSQLSMKTDLIEFTTYVHRNDIVHKYTPFQGEIREESEGKRRPIEVEKLDTIIVPANEEGFDKVFLGQNCWYAIRMSSSMIDRIKYIAGYQTAPISAITYYAPVEKIEKYKNTGKYIVYFKTKAKKIGPIKVSIKRKGAAPQAPRYTSFQKIKKAKVFEDI